MKCRPFFPTLPLSTHSVRRDLGEQPGNGREAAGKQPGSGRGAAEGGRGAAGEQPGSSRGAAGRIGAGGAAGRLDMAHRLAEASAAWPPRPRGGLRRWRAGGASAGAQGEAEGVVAGTRILRRRSWRWALRVWEVMGCDARRAGGDCGAGAFRAREFSRPVEEGVAQQEADQNFRKHSEEFAARADMPRVRGAGSRALQQCLKAHDEKFFPKGRMRRPVRRVGPLAVDARIVREDAGMLNLAGKAACDAAESCSRNESGSASPLRKSYICMIMRE